MLILHSKNRYYYEICLNILNCIHLGKANVEKYMRSNVFNLPTKTFISNYMKSFCNDPFDDEFSQTLRKSDVK